MYSLTPLCLFYFCLSFYLRKKKKRNGSLEASQGEKGYPLLYRLGKGFVPLFLLKFLRISTMRETRVAADEEGSTHSGTQSDITEAATRTSGGPLRSKHEQIEALRQLLTAEELAQITDNTLCRYVRSTKGDVNHVSSLQLADCCRPQWLAGD